jgi:hypothetical protein
MFIKFVSIFSAWDHIKKKRPSKWKVFLFWNESKKVHFLKTIEQNKNSLTKLGGFFLAGAASKGTGAAESWRIL